MIIMPYLEVRLCGSANARWLRDRHTGMTCACCALRGGTHGRMWQRIPFIFLLGCLSFTVTVLLVFSAADAIS